MKLKLILKTAALVMAAVVAAASLSGCGVSKSEFNSLKERVAALEDMYGTDIPETASSGSSRASKATPRPTEEPERDDRSSDENNKSSEKFDSDTVGEDIDVIEYDYLDNDGKKFAFFVFDNDSDYDVDADISIECRGSNDRNLGKDSKTLKNLESGQRSYVGFELDEDTETIVRTVNYNESRLRGTRLSDIGARAARAQGGVNLTVTNNGADDADDLKYLVIFFDGSSMVGFDSNNLPNLKAGENVTLPSVCYEDFDRADVFIAVTD